MRTSKAVICQPIGNYFFILCFNMFVLFQDDFVFLKLWMSVIITVIKWAAGIFLVKKNRVTGFCSVACFLRDKGICLYFAFGQHNLL